MWREEATERQSDRVWRMDGAGAKVRTFRDLLVWQKAIRLVTEIYSASQGWPKEETFGLKAQIRRAAVSIPSNIAEGHGRRSHDDYLRFLHMSMGSLFEALTQLEIARNLNFFNAGEYDRLLELGRELERMMSSLIRKLKESGG